MTVKELRPVFDFLLRLPQFKIVGENENTSDLIANLGKPGLKPSQAFSERSDSAEASNRIPALRKYIVLLKYSHPTSSNWFFVLGQTIRKQDVCKLE